MAYKVTISDGTILEKSIESVTFKADTPPDDYYCMQTYTINSVMITGRIGAGEKTISLYEWALLSTNTPNCYKEIVVEQTHADQTVRAVKFSKAFVVDYSESFSKGEGFGLFSIFIRQLAEVDIEITNEITPQPTMAEPSNEVEELSSPLVQSAGIVAASSSVKNNRPKLTDIIAKKTIVKDNNRNIADTGGLRNELPLTETQVQELTDYAKKLGFPEDDIVICGPDNTNNTGLLYGRRLYINNDVLPSTMTTNTPNSLISGKGTIAHEVVGHYETVSKGTAFETQYIDTDGTVKYNLRNLALDEAQASIRAAKFAPDLSQGERIMLIRDGLTRLKNQGIKLKDVKQILDIFNR